MFSFGQLIILSAIFISSVLSIIIPCGIEHRDEDLEDKNTCLNCGEHDMTEIDMKKSGKIYLCKTCGQAYFVHKRD